MGFKGEMGFTGTATNDPQLALAMEMTLDNLLKKGIFSEGVKHILTIYKDGQEITRQDLAEDYKKYCKL